MILQPRKDIGILRYFLYKKGCDPGSTDGDACGKESRIVCHQSHGHKSAVRESTHIDALMVDIGTRFYELIDQGLQRLRLSKP